MVSIIFTVEGADEIKSRLTRIAEAFSNEIIPSVLKDASEQAVQNMQSDAPVRTGFLRDHITITEQDEKSFTITSAAPYSGFVEFGTRKMRAQPFFEPNVVIAEQAIEQEITQQTQDLIGG